VRIRRASVNPSSGRPSTGVRQRRFCEYTRPAEPPATRLGPRECYPDHGTAGRKRQSV